MVYESCCFGAEVEIVGDTEKLRGYQKKRERQRVESRYPLRGTPSMTSLPFPVGSTF